jgi:hypothetical protein
LTVTGNPLSDGVDVQDVFVVRLGVTSVDTAGTTITESALSGVGGLAVNAETDKVLRIIQGTGKGQQWPIASNTATTVTINGAFDPIPDTTSIWIITEAAVYDSADSPSMPVTMGVANEAGSTVVVEVDCVDQYGQESVNNLAPVRDIYIWGCQGTRTVTTTSTQTKTDGHVFCDSTAGSFTFQLLPFAQVANQSLLVQKISSDLNTVTVAIDPGDVTAGITFSDGTTSCSLVNQGDPANIQF